MIKHNTPSQLGGQAAFFLIGNVFTLIVGLPLQIYVARSLGASNLGVFSLLEGGVGLISGLIGFGLAPTLVKFLPQHLENKEYSCIRMLVWKGLQILTMSSLIVFASGWVALPWIEEHWPQLQEYHISIALMGLMVPLGILMFYLGQGLRGFQEIRYMVIGSSFLQLTVKAGLAILLLSLGMDLFGYITAVVLSMVVALIWLGVGLLRKIRSMPRDVAKADESVKKSWFNYAKIMYGGSLLSVLTANMDRFLIGLFASVSSVGVLAVIKQLQQLPVMFLQMFLTVAAPMFSAAHARNDVEERQYIYHLTTDWVLRASLPLFLFFMLFSAPLLNLYGKEFVEQGVWPLWILISAQLINLMCGPLGNVLNMSGMESQMLRINIIQTIITATGLLVFVPLYGLMGGASVLAAGILFVNGAALYIAAKRIQLQWWNRRYLKWIAPAVVSCATGFGLLALESRPGPIGLVACLIILYVVFHGVFLLQGLHDDDRELLIYLRDKITGKTA